MLALAISILLRLMPDSREVAEKHLCFYRVSFHHCVISTLAIECLCKVAHPRGIKPGFLSRSTASGKFLISCKSFCDSCYVNTICNMVMVWCIPEIQRQISIRNLPTPWSSQWSIERNVLVLLFWDREAGHCALVCASRGVLDFPPEQQTIHKNFVYDVLIYVKRCYQCLLPFLLLFDKFHIQPYCYENFLSKKHFFLRFRKLHNGMQCIAKFGCNFIVVVFSFSLMFCEYKITHSECQCLLWTISCFTLPI